MMFANSGKPRDDDCARALRARTNQVWAAHQVYNPRKCVTAPQDDDVTRFAACHRNLRFKKGVGNVDSCNVDTDSRMRGAGNQARKRHQLFPREFVAVPDMSHGDFAPDVDSLLSRGAEREHDKRPSAGGLCDHSYLAEREYDRFVPLMPCLLGAVQNPDNIVPSWAPTPSRIVNRSAEFLQNCGFHLADERKNMWVAK